jgi:very-short-patch-repair endonuclease
MFKSHKHSLETRMKIGLAHTGCKHNAEAKKKMSLSQTGRKRSPETKKKISLFHTGLRHSIKTKKKMSLTRKQFLNIHPEALEAMLHQLHQARVKASQSKQATKIELLIQEVLEQIGVVFRTQEFFKFKHQWCLADFYLPELNLVIECDGDYWHNLPENKKRDREKNLLYKQLDLKLIRLREQDILLNSVQALYDGIKNVS